ncbi:MAG: RNA methyltransferase [Deltaproteobacteria bacterium]|nr:MAG: RNA methyltransferase [Deltaproteobacteria bacterium]
MESDHIAIALVHYPVYDREGREVATALTTIDLHDLSRIARTYGLGAFFVITPLRSQRELGERMIRHWIEGRGREYNPTRGEALKLVRFADTLEGAREEWGSERGGVPKTIATSAKRWRGSVGYEVMAERLRDERAPFLLLFGTGWGLSARVIEGADFILDPIEGKGYNHLSVRAAAAIIIDRLLGGITR